MVEDVISNVKEVMSLDESLGVVLSNSVGDTIVDYDEVVVALDRVGACSYFEIQRI